MLLAAPKIASLESINDANGFIANFWRAVQSDPVAVAKFADYPISHIDLGARQKWLMEQRGRLAEGLLSFDWPGDHQVAGYWVWGQCAGMNWCDWYAKEKKTDFHKRMGLFHDGRRIPDITSEVRAQGTRPNLSNGIGIHSKMSEEKYAGVQAQGTRPNLSDNGVGIHSLTAEERVKAVGTRPHIANLGRGIQAATAGVRASGSIPRLESLSGIHALTAEQTDDDYFLTSAGRAAHKWLQILAVRLERVRITHGYWTRCLYNHVGQDSTAVFLDPPYDTHEDIYGDCEPVAKAVGKWAKKNENLRIALCGHEGEYDLPGWDTFNWYFGGASYVGAATTVKETIWFSPGCIPEVELPNLLEDFGVS